jgi:site-specific DNA recombinase
MRVGTDFKELAKVIKDQDVLVEAILAGTPAEQIKSKLEQLELRQKQFPPSPATSSVTAPLAPPA